MNHRSESILVFLLAAICAWAVIPQGSVSYWAQAVLLIAVSGMAAGVWLFTSPPRVTVSRHFTLLLVAGGLLLWSLVQIVPLPVAVLARLQPLDDGLYHIFFGDGGIAPIALDRHVVLSKLAEYLIYFLSGWAVLRISRKRNAFRMLLILFSFIGVLEAFYGLIDASGAVHGGRAFRLQGSFPGANAFAGFLSMTATLTLALLLTLKREKRPDGKRRHQYAWWPTGLLVMSLVIQYAALIMSASRGGVISAALAMGLFTGWFFRKSLYGRKSGAEISIVLLILFVFLGTGGMFSLAVHRFGLLSSPSTQVIPRILLWRAAFRVLRAFPLGVGPGCFSLAVTRFQPPGFGVARAYHAHNDYLEVLCETGIPGGIILLAGLVFLIRSAVRRFRRTTPDEMFVDRRLQTAAFCGVLGALAHSLVDFNLSSRPGVALFFWILMALAFNRPDKHVAVSKTNRVHRRGFPQIPVRLGAAFLFGLLILHSVRTGMADWLSQTGFAACGGKPGIYFWLPAPASGDRKAAARLQRAVRISPHNPGVLYLAGWGRLIKHQHLMQAAIAENSTRTADFRAVRSTVFMAMRIETREAGLYAKRMFARALQESPWHPEIQAAYGLAVFMADSKGAGGRGDSCRKRAMRHLKVAMQLAPVDIFVRRIICRALVTALRLPHADDGERAEYAALLEQQVVRIIRWTGVCDPELLQMWEDAGFSPVELFAKRVLPLNVIRRGYYWMAALNDSDAALACLHNFEAVMNAGKHMETERLGHKKNIHNDLTKNKEWLRREKARWLIESRKFGRYRAMYADHTPCSHLSAENEQNLPAGIIRFPVRFPAVNACLHGIMLAPAADERSPGYAIRMYWTFTGNAPPDLELYLALTGADRHTYICRRLLFVRSFPLRFSAGMPDRNHLFVTDFKVPPIQRLAPYMLFGLRRKKDRVWVKNSYGLTYMKIRDWHLLCEQKVKP